MYNSDNPGFSTAGDTTRRAVIIKFLSWVGINTKGLSRLETLRYAEEDAYEVYRILRQDACGFNYIDPVLTGEKGSNSKCQRRNYTISSRKNRTELFIILLHWTCSTSEDERRPKRYLPCHLRFQSRRSESRPRCSSFPELAAKGPLSVRCGGKNSDRIRLLLRRQYD